MRTLSFGLWLTVASGCTVPLPAGIDSLDAADQLNFSGRYRTSGEWDLSHPLRLQAHVGEDLARTMVDQLAEAVPAPGFLYGDIRQMLEGDLGQRIQTSADTQLPPPWQTTGAARAELIGQLSRVELETVMTLHVDGSSVTGQHEIVSIRIPSEPMFEVNLSEFDRSALVTQLSGHIEAHHLILEEHAFQLTLAALAEQVLASHHRLSPQTIDLLLDGTIDCQTLLEDIGATSGWSQTFFGQDVHFEPDMLHDLCQFASHQVAAETQTHLAANGSISVSGALVGHMDPTGWEVVGLQSDGAFSGRYQGLSSVQEGRIAIWLTAERE